MSKTVQQKRRAISSLFTSVPAVVYRVQDADGRGPWKPGFSKVWLEDRTEEEYALLRTMYEEFPGLKFDFGKNYGCGCTSLEQLRKWIKPGEYDRLRKYGYKCVEMKADHLIAQSKVQCVFERSAPLSHGVKFVDLYPRRNQ